MKATVERNTLLAALGRAKKVVERLNSIPILSNILIRAEDDLQFQSTDMDMALTESVQADIAEPGAVTVAVYAFHDLVKSTPKGCQVELETVTHDDVDNLVVRAGRSRFILPTLPVEDYPQMAAGKMPCRFVLGSAELHGLIKPVRHAISTEETRYYLNGIFLTVAAENGVKTLRAVATDGHRLAQADVQLPVGAAKLADSIIPTKAVNIIYGLAGKHDGRIEVKASETRISFAFGPVTFLSKLVDGTYPDVQRVIPTENGLIMTADRAQLTAVFKRVSMAACEIGSGLRLALATGSLTVSASSPEGGKASEEVEVVYTGMPHELGFNARYLADILGAMDGADVEFAMADAASPAVIRDPADSSTLHVLMPMRISF